LRPVVLKPDVYWAGAVDWKLRNFHGYTTNRGATYNAYLIVDEKTALIDTVKAPFAQELLERVEQIIPLEKVDYLICNHVEMDHSGSLPEVMKRIPNARVVCSVPQGVKGLTAHYGDYPYQGVKAGDSLSLGKRTLTFVHTPMLHWPDNMVSYCPEEKILFSNDAFGQHYASSKRFDDEVPLGEVMQEAAKYYANIVMPFHSQVKGALKAAAGLDIDVIAPSHGVMWRSSIERIVDAYAHWSFFSQEPDALRFEKESPETAVVVYQSMWRSTEKIAYAIADGFISRGIPTKLRDLDVCHRSDIMTDILEAKYIAVGSPTLNNNMLPDVAAFLTYMRGLAPKGRKGFAFGSYGWSGQSVAQVEEMLTACGVELLCEKMRLQYIPDGAMLSIISGQVENMKL